MNPLDPAQILSQHQGFVRALAHRLVAAAEADDLAQETFLRAIERPPRNGSGLRAWLRTVATNLARNRQRHAAHRAGRERAAARPEAVPAVDEDVAQAELLRSVLDGVLELDEPYRTTLLARYFRGRTSAQVARELGVPHSTVRSREQRALARLRERLDRGGDRKAWGALLVRWLQRTEPEPWLPVPPAVLTLAAASLVVVAAVAWRMGASRGIEGPTSGEAGHIAPVLGARTAPAVSLAAAASVAPSSRTPAAPGSAAGSAVSALVTESCEVRGRLVLPDGTPATGQRVELEGWVGEPYLGVEFGEPEHWTPPTTTTGADGRFSLVFDPPRAYGFELTTKRDGFAREVWQWGSLAEGELRDVGEIVLRPGGTLEGHVRTPEGLPVEGLGVRADGQTANVHAAGDRLMLAWEFCEVDAATGKYRMENLPPGRVQLSFGDRHGRHGGWVDGPSVVLVPGQTRTVDLTWAPPPRVDIRVTASAWPFWGVPAPENVRLLTEGSPERHPSSQRGSLFLFEGLTSGPFTVEIEDPRFEFWRREGVERGDEIEASLRGNSVLWLDVRDEAGLPISVYRVLAERLGDEKTSRFMLHDGRSALPGGRLEGLVAGDVLLTVQVEGRGCRSVEVLDLLPGESRSVEVRFEPSPIVTGHARFADGAPVVGGTVRLLRPAAIDDSPESRVLPPSWDSTGHERLRRELNRSRTDGEGAFRLVLSGSGDCALHASLGPARETATETFFVGSGEQAEIDLLLPRGGRAAGSIGVVGAESLAELRVFGLNGHMPLSVGDEEPRWSSLDASGAFDVGPWPEGPVDLYVGLTSRPLAHFAKSGARVHGARLLGTVSIEEGEVTRADFDASALRPGRVSVQVLVEGEPCVGVRVGLCEPSFSPNEDTYALTDFEGRAVLSSFPGDFLLRVTDRDHDWSHAEPGTIHVTPGGQSSHVVQVSGVSGG